MNSSYLRQCQIAVLVVAGMACAVSASAQSLANKAVSISVNAGDGSYQLAGVDGKPVLSARVGAEVDHKWLRSSEYGGCKAAESKFNDDLGAGKQIAVTCAGTASKPELTYVLQAYDQAPYGTVQVKLRNTTGKKLSVQAIRSVEAIGESRIELGANAAADRVLSDSFSEDWPDLKIYDLAQAPEGLHRGVGSQLIYNRESKQGLFLGALTSEKFLTILRLKTDGAKIGSYEVDATGTTEIQRALHLEDSPAEDVVELSLPLAAGETMTSDRLMLAIGGDYHAQLLAYGDAIRRLHHARVNGETPVGWWSWTAYYGAINQGEVLANADWLSQNLASLGYTFFQVDEGYQYARGEFTTTNATQFPDGMRVVGHHIVGDGLVFGLWTAPFEITTRSWVFQNHKDWLVKNAKGQPIPIGDVWGQHVDTLYAIDTTNPGAQEYLRQTYKTIVREWGVRFIKLDFMDTTAIEGYYYKPNTTALEAQRIGLQIIRDTVGDEVILDKDGSPMLNPVGLVDSGRVSADTGHNFERTKAAEPGIAARFYMHRNFFINDPDAYNVTDSYLMEEHEQKPPVTLAGAQASIALSAISGGNYEIGDDMLLLGREKDRLALASNIDLINMIRIGRAATPVDLLTYASEDEQPSVFFLREDQRQAVLVVFNWTKSSRTHQFQLADLGLPASGKFEATDVLNGNAAVALGNGALRIADQSGESVRVIKIVDSSVQPSAPVLKTSVPETAKAGETIHCSVQADLEHTPATTYRWDFGDGTHASGKTATHAYPTAGEYSIQLVAEGLDGVPANQTFTVKVTGNLPVMPQLKDNRRFVEPTERK
ncbi:glycoside hydrolase/PKD [Candidatus Koribacter versatilis Ellin345]|uniref:Glycoside hydrolase/PKD n=1 Tax=Koribacter versatilis (strain Ellin345) TaxID=204669 RepID=Q1IT53_KORVE|nr:PKD domain-containing protein [Candidatus Koribacter versatilis]ABF39947.1 glycoside hydrolase/PKD [Candidatus Koribacter versatilis Ellin345]